MSERLQKVKMLGFGGMVEMLKKKYSKNISITPTHIRADMAELLNIFMVMYGKVVKNNKVETFLGGGFYTLEDQQKAVEDTQELLDQLSEIEERIDPKSPDKNYISEELPVHIRKVEDLIYTRQIPSGLAEATDGLVSGLKILTPPNLLFRKHPVNSPTPPPLPINKPFRLDINDDLDEERCCNFSVCTIM